MHTRDLVRFLAELAENNNRAWFVMNKPRYDILRAEFLDLVTGLIGRIGRFDPAVSGCDPKKALFRINRDMRFSKDKSPYKTQFSAAITASGLKKPSQGGGPAYYFHIDQAGRLLVAGGEYMPPADRLRAIRQEIVENPAGFAKTMKTPALRKRYGELRDEGKLARIPKGFEAHEALADVLKHKSYIVWTETDIGKQVPADLAAELAAAFKDAYPLVAWLRAVR
ncbi:MAG TPA: DUF2461 domain-containing protein [Noviherbaspirillum sp.]|nr:DUF2461 domain-containing protein [Noviherbaspirillum sp.]